MSQPPSRTCPRCNKQVETGRMASIWQGYKDTLGAQVCFPCWDEAFRSNQKAAQERAVQVNIR